jgi:hypothetical protein
VGRPLWTGATLAAPVAPFDPDPPAVGFCAPAPAEPLESDPDPSVAEDEDEEPLPASCVPCTAPDCPTVWDGGCTEPVAASFAIPPP